MKAQVNYGATELENGMHQPFIQIDVQGMDRPLIFTANFYLPDREKAEGALKEIFDILGNPVGRKDLTVHPGGAEFPDFPSDEAPVA